MTLQVIKFIFIQLTYIFLTFFQLLGIYKLKQNIKKTVVIFGLEKFTSIGRNGETMMHAFNRDLISQIHWFLFSTWSLSLITFSAFWFNLTYLNFLDHKFGLGKEMTIYMYMEDDIIQDQVPLNYKDHTAKYFIWYRYIFQHFLVTVLFLSLFLAQNLTTPQSVLQPSIIQWCFHFMFNFAFYTFSSFYSCFRSLLAVYWILWMPHYF